MRDRIHRPGTLFSAGLITGEALMGIAIAIPIVVSGSADVLALPEQFHFGQLVGLAVLVVVGWLLYRSGAKKNALGDVEPKSEEHTSELQSLMRNSYPVFCLKKKINNTLQTININH